MREMRDLLMIFSEFHLFFAGGFDTGTSGVGRPPGPTRFRHKSLSPGLFLFFCQKEKQRRKGKRVEMRSRFLSDF